MQIEVSQRDNILKEMEFSLSGCSDESCMLEVGKMLSAESISTPRLKQALFLNPGATIFCARKQKR